MVFLFVDMFDNLSLPICHISSFTQHGFTMSESLETQRQGGFSTCVLKVFKVMRVAFFFLSFKSHGAEERVWRAPTESWRLAAVSARTLTQTLGAKHCWARSRTKLLARLQRPQSGFYYDRVERCQPFILFFFHFTTVTSTVILQDRDRKTGWERMRDFGQTLLLYLFIYVGNYFLSVQQAVLSKTCCPLARRMFQCSVEVPEFPFFRNINLPNEWCPHYNTDYKSNQITESRVSN